jgi:putative intracellular protease/amidase
MVGALIQRGGENAKACQRRRRKMRCPGGQSQERAKDINMKILMVLTSHDQLGETGRKTGFWLEEFAAPYFTFKDAGADITIVSPKGGLPPLDPMSNEPHFQTELTHRYWSDPDAQLALANGLRLDSVSQEDFDTIFYPGGHGPMWDLAEDMDSVRLIETTLAAGKPAALVCHAPIALRHAIKPDGSPLVEGKRVTCFTNSEEAAVGLTKIVPFLVEDEMRRLGAIFSSADDWKPHVVSDGLLITGQSPASSGPTAKALLERFVPLIHAEPHASTQPASLFARGLA